MGTQTKKINPFEVLLNEFKQYQQKAHQFAQYKEAEYPYYLLVEEAGELVGKYAKLKRGDYQRDAAWLDAVKKEISDLFWAISELAILSNMPISVIDNLVFDAERGLEYELLTRILSASFVLFSGYKIRKDEQTVFLLSVFFAELVMLCETLNFDLVDVWVDNINKLQSRLERGVIQGNGDNR